MSIHYGQDITLQLRQWNVREVPASSVVRQGSLKAGRRTLIQKGILNLFLGAQSQVVIKIVNTNYAIRSKDPSLNYERLVEYFKRECRIWRNLGKHENIASLLGFIAPTGGDLFPALVMHHYPWGDLRSFVTAHGENVKMPERIMLMFGVAKGLAHMHSTIPAAIHRDLKGNNILVEVLSNGRMNARISDFGSAKLNQVLSEIPGGTSQFSTLNWCPPEHIMMINGKLNTIATIATKEADIWSYACTFLETLKGADPWPRSCRIEDELRKGRHPPRPEAITIDDRIWAILEQCWRYDPALRLTAREVVTKVHSYLKVYSEESRQCAQNDSNTHTSM